MSGPSRRPHNIPNVPSLPSPSSSRPRASLTSISSSFSYDPQHLVHSLLNASNDIDSPNASRHSLALDPNRSVLTASPLRSSPRPQRRVRESKPHPLAARFNVDVLKEDDVNEEEAEWGLVDLMRLWRHDAIMQHLYESAAFWGDKVLSWTNDPNDAFWLAQTYFSTHQYSRAERLLTRPFPWSPTPPSSPQPQTNGHAPEGVMSVRNSRSHSIFASSDKGKGKVTEATPSIGPGARANTDFPRIPVGPGAMVGIAADFTSGISRLVDMSVLCRYLAAQCQIRQGKWTEATEMLGDANPFRGTGRSGPQIANVDGGIKVEASMCHLRGLLMLKLNRGEAAKECFMEALALDVKCYDAFEQLISGQMMTPDEEWEFVQGLAYREQTPMAAEFVRLIYIARLRKYKHAEEHALARRRLTEEFGLSDNPDVLFSFADALYAQFRWADCYAITSRILDLVAVHTPTMPVHIACMHHLPHLHSKLFVLAHELVDKEPEEAMSWYAVGVWYLTAKKWAEARTYFSKTSLMDPRFAPAWIAFGHTFALEGEHEHAVTAYSTCARLFTGSHLPLMFVGMEHITLSNHDMADEALNAANSMCDGDPLLINERGVMAFNHGQYADAAALFKEAIELAKITQGSHTVWASTYINLGTALQKTGHLEEARDAYRSVLDLEPRHAVALAYLGKTYHLMDDIDAAITKYHESLSIDPVNGHVIELLNLALEANADVMAFRSKDMSVDSERRWIQAQQQNRKRDGQVAAAKERASRPKWTRDDSMVVEK